tara:strand:- start:3012 stop:3179 length:168 start_codon:yes stop_codon:yes gene_type:complete
MKINLTDAAMFAVAVVGIYSWLIAESIKNTLAKEEEDVKKPSPSIKFRGRTNERA